MGERVFDLGAFYARVAKTAKERAVLRQDLVRGLKDYFIAIYGYDRYGAETVFLVAERMSQPYVYGFALQRILHDRRLSETAKDTAAEIAVESISYGQEQGTPYGLFAALQVLASHNRLTTGDLRYVLVASAGEYHPFRGLDKQVTTGFFAALLAHEGMPAPERLLWAHSLITRHQDSAGGADLIKLLMTDEGFPAGDRLELCRAWVHFRQPRLTIDTAPPGTDPRAAFVAEHLPFWVAHSPSWPTASMVRMGLVWLARLGEDPVRLTETYIGYRAAYADQVHSAVADIVAEQRSAIPDAALRNIIEQGVAMSGSIVTRRKFYSLGNTIFGDAYLRRATEDTASSVRQWATRQLQSQV